jgi:hypothetical protein
MAGFAQMPDLEVWYAKASVDRGGSIQGGHDGRSGHGQARQEDGRERTRPQPSPGGRQADPPRGRQTPATTSKMAVTIADAAIRGAVPHRCLVEERHRADGDARQAAHDVRHPVSAAM